MGACEWVHKGKCGWKENVMTRLFSADSRPAARRAESKERRKERKLLPLANWRQLMSLCQYLRFLREKWQRERGRFRSRQLGHPGLNERSFDEKERHSGDDCSGSATRVALKANMGTLHTSWFLYLPHIPPSFSCAQCTLTPEAPQTTVGIHVNAICTSN